MFNYRLRKMHKICNPKKHTLKHTCSQIHIRHANALICSSGSVQSTQSRQSTVNSVITDRTSKIICATQTVYQINNYMKANDQLTLENILPSHTHR